MMHLLKQDLKNLNWKSYFLILVLFNLALAGLLFFIVQMIEPADLQAVYPNYPDYPFVYQSILTVVRIATILSTAAFLVKLILSEYKNNTISILFLYPIPRWKLLLSKLLLVGSCSGAFFLLSVTLSFSFFSMANLYSSIIREPLASFLTIELFLMTMINAVVIVLAGFIPLFFGMIRKSSIALWVAAASLAIIFYLPVYSPDDVIVFGENPIVFLILVTAGVVAVWNFLYRADRKDII